MPKYGIDKKTRPAALRKVITYGALMIGASAFPYASAFAIDDSALPSGGSVTNGSASFDYTTPNELHIQQNTDRVTINWNSFNIGKAALTQFHQPGVTSIAVNKVTGTFEPTQILGTLKANGQVVILDQNGVIFGSDSRVDVGGILASTGNIDDASFMAGADKLELTGIDTGGAIVNEGHITVAEAGLAAFVAPSVINNGVIEAKMGRVVLASGAAATVDLYGDGLVEVAPSGSVQDALVKNAGTINVAGGTVKMSASAAQSTINSVINTSGIVNVASVTQKGGKIILEGPSVKVSGTLDASGATGGGSIKIGGDYQGGGTMARAQTTDIADTAVIKANTTGADGNGGDVIVWSDGNTKFDGTIEAKGGSTSGDGGLVETSGKVNLRVTGSVNASANNASGKAGEWLLDPQNVQITNSGNAISSSGGIIDPTGTANPYIILDSSISTALSNGNNVTITTVNAGQAQSGIITLNNATILKSSGGDATLTFKADAGITTTGTNSITSSSGKLNTIFWVDADNSGTAASVNQALGLVNTTINTNGGDFFAGGGLDNGADINDSLGSLIYDGVAGDGRPDNFAITSDSHGLNIQNTSITSGAGNVTILGRGGNSAQWANGVRLYGGSITTSSGNIVIVGEGSSSINQTAFGIDIENGFTISSTTTGTVTLSGKGGAGADSRGIRLTSGNTISALNGAINLIGKGGTGGTSNDGIQIAGNITSTGNAAITIKGERGGSGNGIALSGNGNVGGVSATGNQQYIADTMSISSTASMQTSGSITVKPQTASTNINIGGPTGGLDLTDAMLARFFAGTKLVIGDSALGTGDIIVDSWDLSGKTFGVELYSNDITLRDTDATVGVDYAIKLGTGNLLARARTAGGDEGSITIDGANLTKDLAGNSSLTLKSDSNIAAINTNGISSTNGKLDVILWSDADNSGAGSVNIMGTTINTNGGELFAGGGLDNGGTLNDAFGNVIYTGVAADGRPDGFAISSGDFGVNISGSSTVTTGAGNVTLLGRGGTGATWTYGVRLYGPGSISTSSGNILIVGEGGTSSTQTAQGIDYSTGFAISSSTTGSITMSGKAGSGASSKGITVYSGQTLSAHNGAITLIGTGGTGTGGNDGVHLGGNVTSTGQSVISVKGTAGTSGSGIYANGTIGGASATGNQSYIADTMGVTGTATLQTAGSISIKPFSSSSNINIGGGSGGLTLSDTALSRMFAGTLLSIGDSALGTGDILVDSWDLSAKTHNVELYGNDITFQDTDATGGVDYALNFSNSTVTATARNGSILVNAKAQWNVNTKDLILNADQDITINAEIIGSLTNLADFTVDAGRDVIVNSNVTAKFVTLNAGRHLTVETGATVTSGGTGSIILTAADENNGGTGLLTLNGVINIGSGSLRLVSGTDGVGGRTDILLDNTHLLLGGTDISGAVITGFRDITFSKDLTARNFITAKAYRDILVTSGTDLKAGTGQTLSLSADRDISLNTATLTSYDGAAFNVLLNADRNADQDGSILISASTITTNGGFFVAGGGSGTLWGVDGIQGTADDAASTGADNVAAWGNSTYAAGIQMVGSSITTNAGTISLKGRGYASSTINAADTSAQGVRLRSTSLTSTSGAVKIDGTAGGTGAAGFVIGTFIKDGSHIVTDSGNVTIRGTGGSGSNGNRMGIAFSSSGINDVSTNSGSVTLTGNSDSANAAITLNSSGGSIATSGTGTINLTAESSYINISSGFTVGGNNAAGDIRLTMNDISQNGVIRTTGAVYIKTQDPTYDIGLGAALGALNLDDAELSLINAGTKLVIGDSATTTGNIIIDSWDLSGKTYAVEIYGNDITLQDTDATAGVDYAVNLGSGNFIAHAIDNDSGADKATLAVNAQIKKTVAGTSALTLRSDQDIIFTSSNITATTGTLNTVLNADRDADSDGRISLTSSAITTNNGYFVAGGGAGTLWGTDGIQGTADDTASTGADKIAAWGNSSNRIGIAFSNGDVSTGTGVLILNGNGVVSSTGNGAQGISLLVGSYLQSTTGNITITGTGGGQSVSADASNYGITLNNSVVESNGGNIALTGTGGGGNTGTDNYGIYVRNGADITSLGNGSISLTGTGGYGADPDGMRIDDNGTTVTNQNGSITLTGTSINGSGSGVDAVLVYNSAIVEAKGAGAITITGTNNISGGGNYGHRIYNATVRSTGGGTITITGSTVNGNDLALEGTGALLTSGGANTGDITINSDRIAVASTGSITSTRTLTFKTRTVGTSIGLAGGTGTFNLSDSELARLTAATLIIGDSTGAGYNDMIVDSWNLSAKTHNVELYGNDITFQDTDATAGVDYSVNLGTGNFMVHAIDKDTATVDKALLAVNAAITKSLAGTSLLDLRSDRDIVFTSANITTTTGSLNTVLNSDRDADQDGAIWLTSSAVTTNSGYFVAGGGSGTVFGIDGIQGTADDATSTGADNVAAWGNTDYYSGVRLFSSSVNTVSGNLYVTGHGWNGSVTTDNAASAAGVRLRGSSLTTQGTGNLKVTGIGGGTGAGNYNIGIYALENSTITTFAGAMTLTGTAGGGSGIVNYGVAISSTGTNFFRTTNGAVNITGTAATTSRAISTGGEIRSLGTGTIALNSTAGMIAIGNAVGGGSASGNITLTGDEIEILGGGLQTTATVLIKANTASTAINLGYISTGLNLNDAELGQITAGTLIIGDSVNGTGDMIVDSWDLSGKTFGVQLYANDITFQDTDATVGVDYAVNLGTGNFMAHAKDKDTATVDKAELNVNAAILKSLAGTSLLHLQSDQHLNVTSNITAISGLLNIALNADRDADQSGEINVASTSLTTNGGYFVAGGGSGALWGVDGVKGTADDAASTGADKIASYGTNGYTNATVSTGAGDIIINTTGTTNSSLVISDSTLQTTSGKIQMTSEANGAGTFAHGITMVSNGAGSKILSTSGDIVINASGSLNATGSGHGLRLEGANEIATSSGLLNITGKEGFNGSGIQTVSAGLQKIGSATATGNIILNLDTLNMVSANASSYITTQGTITVKPRTANTSIGLGGGTGTLTIDDKELGFFNAGTLIIGDSALGTGDMIVDSWDLSGKTFGIQLYANDITFQDTDATAGVDYAVKLGTGNFLAHAIDNDSGGDKALLTLNAAILKSVAGTSLLDLRSDRDIAFTSGNITATTGTLNTVLNSDRDADQDGSINGASSAIVTNNGFFVAGGGSGTLWGVDGIQGTADDSASTGADRQFAWGNSMFASGVGLNNVDISTGSGTMTLNGHGYNLAAGDNMRGIVVLNDSVLQSTSGAIRLTGTGGNGDDGNNGIQLSSGTTKVTSERGPITLTGIGGSDGTVDSDLNIGVRLESGVIVESTGTGADAATITFDGTGANGDDDNIGIFIVSSTTKVTSNRGDIVMTGRGGSNNIAGSLGNNGFYVYNGSTVESTGLANITINGYAATGGSSSQIAADNGTFVATIGGNNAQGDITLNQNGFNISHPVSVRTAGTIYIKPTSANASITVGSGAGGLFLTDTFLSSLTASKLVIGDSALGTGDIIVDSWDLSGKTHNVELYGNDITFQDTDATVGVDYALNLGTGNFMAYGKDAGDTALINVTGPILKSVAGTSTLNLRSDQNITFTAANVTATNGLLNLFLNADANANQNGKVELSNSVIITNGGEFFTGGGLDDGGDITDGFGTVVYNGVAGDGKADGYMVAAGSYGFNLNASTVNTSAGNLTILAKGGSSATNKQIGARLYGGSVLETTNGNILIVGKGGDVAGFEKHWGVSLESTVRIQSTGTGSITVNGTGGNGTNGNQGVFFGSGSGSQIIGHNGAVTITGMGGSGSTIENHGIYLSGGSISSTGQSPIVMKGQRGDTDSATYGIALAGSGTIGGASATGDITIIADTFTSTKTTQTTGSIIVKPLTASTSIGISGGSGTLQLTDSVLNTFTAGKLIIGDSVLGTGDMIVDSWDLSGKTFGVELYANDITFQDTDATVGVDYAVKLGTGNFMAHAKDNDGGGDKADFSITASIQKSLSGTSLLDLRADRSITFNGTNITATTGALNVVLNADRDADQSGGISIINSTFNTNGGWFVGGGGSGTLWGVDGIKGTADDATSTGADNVMAWSSTGTGFDLYSSSAINTGAGDIIINGHGFAGASDFIHGVTIAGTLTNTGTGSIKITGTGGNGTGAGNNGIQISNTVSAGSGGITLTGVGGGSGGSAGTNYGLMLASNISTAGNIILHGTGGSGTSGNRGVRMTGGTINSGAAAINLTAISGQNTNEDFNPSGGTIGGGGQSGTITLNVDSFNGSVTAITTTGSVLIKPRTASRAINIGGTTGGLDLSDAELTLFNAGTLVIGDSALGTGDMIVDSWDLSAKTHNVELYANDITFQDTDATVGVDYALRLGTGNFMAHAKDNDGGADKATLAVNAAIQKQVASTSLLDLRSDRDIVFTSGHITVTTGTLNTILNADRDADLDGAISVTTSTIGTNGGWFVAGGGNGNLWGTDGIQGTADDTTSTGADRMAAWANSSYISGATFSDADISTGSGSIIINGQGRNAAVSSPRGVILSNGSHLETTSGRIVIKGTGGTGTQNARGIHVTGSGTIIESVNGLIQLDGTGGAGTGANNHGIYLDDSAIIRSTGTASDAAKIDIIGVGGNGTTNNKGIRIATGAKVLSVKGDITLTGTGTGLSSDASSTGIRLFDDIIIGSETASSAKITLNSIGRAIDNDIIAGTGTNIIGGTTSYTGDIIFNIDSLTATEMTVQTAGTVLVKPRTSSTNINLGSTVGSGLDLSDTELAMFNAGTLVIGDAANGTGDVDIDTWNLSGKTHNVQVHGRNIDLGGITSGAGDVTLYAKNGNITVSADSNSNGAGDISLLATGDVGIYEDLINTGAGAVNIFAGWDGLSGITTPALFNINDIDLSMIARDITLGADGRVASGGAATSVLLVASDDFVNNSTHGANAVSASTGRYLVYATHPNETVKGGLTAKNIYNRTWAANAPSSITGASRFVYAYQPTITLQTDNISTSDPANAVYSFSAASGLRSDDLLADAIAGTPAYTLGILVGNTRSIVMGLGGLSSPMGYAITLANGSMTVLNAPPVIAPIANSTATSIINHTTNLTKVAMPASQQSFTTSDQVIAVAQMNTAIRENTGQPMGQINMGRDGMGDRPTPNNNSHQPAPNGNNNERENEAEGAAAREPAASAHTDDTASCLIADAETGICIIH